MNNQLFFPHLMRIYYLKRPLMIKTDIIRIVYMLLLEFPHFPFDESTLVSQSRPYLMPFPK